MTADDLLFDVVTNRRRFLIGTAATAGLALLDPLGLARARQAAAQLPAGDVFGLGVASGDPTADGVVLWTRLLDPSGAALPAADIAVEWEVATDDAFSDVVASGTTPAIGALAHSVHAEVSGLAPNTEYRYRFTVDGRQSPVGRTRTFPGAGASPAEVRFALASCQNWSDGHYTAYAAMVADDAEFVVFVGDYIYETSAKREPRPLSIPTSVDLATYRTRYELYRSDHHLQAAHARYPWIITMDDHEVANNVLGDHGQDGTATTPSAKAAFLARRADAFQVWYEHLPMRLAAPDGSSYRIYREVEHSDLLRFFVLDGRQYRSPYPGGASEGVDDPRRHDADRTMLGDAQETWLEGALGASSSRWNVIAQQTVFTAMPIPVGDVNFYNFDQWDGYTANRERLLRSLVDQQVTNPMILSGDIHLAAAAAVRLDYEDPNAPDIANEIVTTSITSRFDPALLDLVQAGLDAAPWTRYGNARRRGYALITVTADEWTTQFRTVDVGSDTATTATTDFTDRVAARAPVTLPTTPTTPTTPGTGSTPVTPGATPIRGNASYTG